MKKPLFDEIERRIMREYESSLSASSMRSYIAIKHFERALIKTPFFRLLERFIVWLTRKLDDR